MDGLHHVPVMVLSCIDQYAQWPVEDAGHKLHNESSYASQPIQGGVLKVQLHGREEQ